MIDNTLGTIRRIIPEKIFGFFQPAYHYVLALLAATVYRFPSKKIRVIGVSGTKGKSSTVELISAMLEEAGYKTALSNTIRFKVGDISSENLFKMSMPGRFYVQKLIRKAVNHSCDFMIIEMTSQGAALYRHKFIDMDAFVFTNLTPEHIEAHGTYDIYKESKLRIARTLGTSTKKNTALIANADDPESKSFLECKSDRKITFSLRDAGPYEVKKQGIDFTLDGVKVTSPLSGLFNLYNILAARSAVMSQGVTSDAIVRSIEKFTGIPGRVERVEAGQDFTVVVDYAHTKDSLEKLYQVFQSSRNICVLGGTGGGRDHWKRAEMGAVADKYCDEIILTDEDPYDEDPKNIVATVATGIKTQTPTIIMDRRQAIHEALKRAKTGDSVLITGKGTDPYIMGPRGTKIPWSDARVCREEIAKILKEV